jgi:arylsulfatase A
MKNSFVILCLITIFYSFSGCNSKSSIIEVEKPNIIFILMDDLGWSAISSYGNQHVDTKNIDNLAAEGMRFTQAYVTPQCTPTRAVIMTGKHTASNRMWHVTPKYYFPYQYMKEPEYLEDLPRETFTIAKALKEEGYKTAIFGKWHLNVYGPDGYYTRLFKENAHHYGFDEVDPMTEPSEYQAYTDKGVEFLTNQTIDFIESNQDIPFFIYLSHHTIHGPILAPDSLDQKYLDLGYPEEGVNHAKYLASIEHFDNSIGRIMQKLETTHLDENTIVIFTSDNGGVDTYFSNSPLRYGKGSPYEGGIRMPFIVRWPGKISEGKTNDTPIHAIDFYPTLVEMAGGECSQYDFLDGLSLVPELMETGKLKRNTLHWYMPLYDRLNYSEWATTPAAVIRKGNYKLIKFFGDYIDISEGYKKHIPGKRIELYNLAKDIGETQNLSESNPDIATELEIELDDWIASTGAGLPSINENYNPDSLWVRGK